MFTRDSSGRSILFPIKEESSRLATSFPYSKRANGKEPPRVGPMSPPTRAHEDAYRVCKPCFVFTHANPRASGNVDNIVEQVEKPTLPDGPVVTPRPPA